MSLPSIISNAIINGNSFNQGILTADGVTPTIYTYNTLVFTSGDCKITDNNFSGASNVMLSLTGSGSSNIVGNYFTRGANNITAYINNTASTDHIIVDNVFDSTTIDGSSEILAVGLTNETIYRENKNQIGYAIINFAEMAADFVDDGYSTVFHLPIVNPTGALIPSLTSSNISRISSFTGAVGHTIKGTASVYLNSRLPFNTQILFIAVSIGNANSGNLNTGTANFTLQPVSPTTFDISNIPSSLNGSVADVGAIAGSPPTLTGVSNDGGTLTLSSASNAAQYMTLNASSLNYRTSSYNDFFFSVNLIATGTSNNTLILLFSPITIKYKW